MADWAQEQFATADIATQASVAELWTDYFKLGWIAGGASDEMLGGSIGAIAGGLASDVRGPAFAPWILPCTLGSAIGWVCVLESYTLCP
jgi:hypothetical protein